ncbi:pentatricopeptide repeat-containing protein At2g33680-like [Tasmannia lanceolata]|uniref:pentatricopeptide repeat-containing protein At2g33680-like n=1 Tax=Tasmannia lanceolata TaxID=3420 RepID=UPI004063BDFD
MIGMLRRTSLLASFPCFSPSFSQLKHNYMKECCRNLTLFNMRKQKFYKTPTCNRQGRVTDVLEIIGRLDNLFPSTDLYFYMGLLRKSIKTNDFLMGRLVHVHLIKLGFEAECSISNVLLDMYAKLGALRNCVQLFDEIPERDLVSWSTLIYCYVSHGFDLEAFQLFKKTQECGLKPNQFIIASVLKACSASGILEFGLQIHGFITKTGFGSDSFVMVGLVDMYAKCGVLPDAHKQFDELPRKNSISWNTMISGYVWNGFFGNAVELCRDMCRAGWVMDLVTLRVVMSAGSALERIEFCKNIHVYSIKVGLGADNFVVTELVRLLAKLGEVAYMSKISNTLKNPDAALFSLIISGFHLHGKKEKALKLVEELVSGLNLNQGALLSILNLCFGKDEGGQIHGLIIKVGYESYLCIGNALISMYIRSGKMEDAIVSFTKMPVRDLVSWTAIMAGNVQNHQFSEALELFCAFRKTGIVLDQYIAATTINACTGLRAMELGKQIHSLVLTLGFEFCDFLTTSLLHMYAKCGYMDTASRLSSFMVSPHSVVSVNVMLSGYCWNSQAGKAVELFRREYQMGMVPDHFTFSTVLGACADLRLMEVGEQIHSRIIKSGLGFSDVIVGNAITNLYVKCGSITDACKSFFGMKRQDANSYAMLMLGYLRYRNSREALRLFYQMHRTGLRANPVAFAVILQGCADLAAIEPGKQIHAYVLKMGLISDICLGSALVSMYAKSGYTDGARKVFDEMSIRDDVLSNAMITGYSQIGNRDRAFEVFELMKWEQVNQDYFSYVGVLSVCASSAALMQGMCVHALVVHSGLESDVSVGNALVDMYAKCGSIRESWDVFKKMKVRDLVSWNAMVSGFAQHGCANEALKLFEEMQMEGVKPDHITYIAVLSACSHVGLVDEGIIRFKSMKEDSGVMALEEHYACMVDILSRAGRLDEAHGFINEMPMEPSGMVWRTLLAACKIHGNEELGMKAAWKILGDKRDDSAARVLLSNIYAMHGRWVDVEIVRNEMRGRGMKEPGCSWIEIKDEMEVYLVGGKRSANASQSLLESKKPPHGFAFHIRDWG